MRQPALTPGLAGWVLGLGLLWACASPPAVPILPVAGVPPPGSVRVRLAFGPEADLDLYVTDPSLETVYYANTPSRSGGILDEDLRCDAEMPRVETILIPEAQAGRYRIGVDFPVRCGRVRGPVPFVVLFETGARRWQQGGEVAFGQFLPSVLEIDLERVR